jgi:exodeoxyribonuclease VII small subunit
MASFEQQLKALEAIVERMEEGDLPLEESVKLFEEGLKLSDDCKKELEAAEGKIQILMDRGRSGMKAVDFDSKPDSEKNDANSDK